MNQDKLEEIARLLGGISDKLDAIAKEQERARAAAVARAMDVFEEVPLFGGYPPLMDTQEAEKAARDASNANRPTPAYRYPVMSAEEAVRAANAAMPRRNGDEK